MQPRYFGSFTAVLALALLGAAQANDAQGNTPGPRETALVAEARSVLKANFFRPLRDSETRSATVDELMQSVDPEVGEYLSAEDIPEVQRGSLIAPNVFGLSFTRKNGKTTVVPHLGGPAAEAGLRQGDRPLEINGKSAHGAGPAGIHRLMPTDLGQSLAIAVERQGTQHRFVIKPDVVARRPDVVSVHRPEPDLLLIRVPQFVDGSLEQASSKVKSEWLRGPPKGLILDLRGNSGGLLVSAVGHASMFLKRNSLIAQLRSSAPVAQGMVFRAKPEDYLTPGKADPLSGLPAGIRSLPLVVLVDEDTAAGAEMVALAVRDNGRGIVMGRRTSGFSALLTTSILPSGGAIRYTSAHWYPPSAEEVHGAGIVPVASQSGTDPSDLLALALTEIRRRIPSTEN